jgi:hypothetical protein
MIQLKIIIGGIYTFILRRKEGSINEEEKDGFNSVTDVMSCFACRRSFSCDVSGKGKHGRRRNAGTNEGDKHRDICSMDGY